jgi:D-lactate dehydrogenase
MTITVFEATADDRAYLEERLADEELRFVEEPLTSMEQASRAAEDAEVLSVFVRSRVTGDMFAAMPRLRLVATRSTGFDHIDLAAADRQGVTVSNVPTYGENTVAEHTFALILALSRKIHAAHLRASSGDFSTEGLQGFDLKGKTIGIVGVGHIGLHVVRIAKGFGMNVLGYDPSPNPTLADLLGYRYTDLTELLNRSDIVSVHAPLNAATRHLIGRHNIHEIKRGALLINTARGPIVDTDALVEALDSGILRGAGLDVLEGEEVFSEEKQLLRGHGASPEALRAALRNLVLLRRPDLVVTPHIGFDSREAVERILETTVENIRRFRAGTPQNVVRHPAQSA